MRAIKVYCPPGVEPPLYAFIDALDGKLKAKLLWQIFRLRNLPACELKEPHFKHFSLERYSQMYELREKGKVLIRIVFTVQNEDIILLTSFIKRQPRDTMKALDQSLYITLSLGICAEALEYDFDGVEDTEYYPSTNYESLYGAKYNYGGSNATDYQWPALPYGVSSNTSVGCMEKVRFPGLVGSIGGSGIESNITNPIQQEPQIPSTSYQPSAYTSVDGMERKDGSIGTLKIPSLNINMKVWEGETNTSMAKGLGHYSSTSGWDGNIGVCGHNRGAKYTIGNIKNLKDGDTITYTTVYGTRTYEVVTVETIASSDWSYLQATSDNRITITTCLANQPSKRVCVQAVEVK